MKKEIINIFIRIIILLAVCIVFAFSFSLGTSLVTYEEPPIIQETKEESPNIKLPNAIPTIPAVPYVLEIT